MEDYTEAREKVIAEYVNKGYKQKDDEFRKSLESGPQERRWLGWAGAKVMVLRVVEGSGAPLCPTNWVYYFVSMIDRDPFVTMRNQDHISESSEINFCGDDDVIERLPPWFRTEDRVEFLRRDIQLYVPMYYI